jgi:hypothetical protein
VHQTVCSEIPNKPVENSDELRGERMMGHDDDDIAKTWSPQQIPPGVPGTTPKPDKEPPADPPKKPERK